MEKYLMPRSVFYRLVAQREHDHSRETNAFLHSADDFLSSQSSYGDRDDALMVLPYGEDADFAATIPRDLRVLLICLMASIAEYEGR